MIHLACEYCESNEILLSPPILCFFRQSLILQTTYVATCGYIVYKVIIPNRKSPLAFLTGYGVVIPLLLSYPYFAINYLEIRSSNIKFLNGMVPLLAMFRTSAGKYAHKITEYKSFNETIY